MELSISQGRAARLKTGATPNHPTRTVPEQAPAAKGALDPRANIKSYQNHQSFGHSSIPSKINKTPRQVTYHSIQSVETVQTKGADPGRRSGSTFEPGWVFPHLGEADPQKKGGNMDATLSFTNNWKKILIVDEYRLVQKLLAAELNDEGYEVEACYNPGGLLKKIQENQPDLVVMETCFENNDGLDVLQEIRNKYYNLPVIIWSASFSRKYDPRALAADYYIVKSPNIDELKQKIKKALETYCPFPPKPRGGSDNFIAK